MLRRLRLQIVSRSLIETENIIKAPLEQLLLCVGGLLIAFIASWGYEMATIVCHNLSLKRDQAKELLRSSEQENMRLRQQLRDEQV